MGRRRLKPSGETVYHHITTRTAQKVFWLEEEAVKDIFVDLIDFYSQVYYVKILAHCVMSNHTHLCLEMNHQELDEEDVRRRHQLAQSRLANPRKFREPLAQKYFNRYTDLSFFMWEINSRMAVAYNKLKKTKGHLWGGRSCATPVKNIVVEPGINLIRLLAYIENNPVRAGIVEDPADFPYSSVGRIKTQQDQGKNAKAPDIALLAPLPEEIRAQTYLDLMRYVAIAKAEPELQRKALPIQFTSMGIEVDMEAMCEALETRAPANWSKPIYGSDSFAVKTYTEVGWLVPIKRTEEAAQKGPAIEAA